MNKQALRSAVETGNLAEVQRLVETVGVDLNPRLGGPIFATLLLFSAAHAGHLEIVSYLLDRGVDMNKVDIEGNTALLRAVAGGRANVVQLLLDRGAHTAMSGQHAGALSFAARLGRLNCVRVLIDHDIRCLTEQHRKIVENGARQGFEEEEVLEFLRTYKPTALSPTDDERTHLQAQIDMAAEQLVVAQTQNVAMKRELDVARAELAAIRFEVESSREQVMAATQRTVAAEHGVATAAQERNRVVNDLRAADATIAEYKSGFHRAYRLLGSFLSDVLPIISAQDLNINRTAESALGRGSNGSVWTGVWNETVVAVKTDFQSLTFSDGDSQKQQAAIGLIRECHALHKLNQWTPHAARLYGLVFDQDSIPTAIVLEKLCPLPTTSQGMSAHQLARLGRHVTAALIEMHGRDPILLHRDIKPENILRTDDNVYKVTDLSEVKLVRHHATRWSAVGTRSFGAPEIGDGTQQTGAVDIYSLGMTITEIFLKVKLNCPENADTAQRQAYNESRVALVTGMDERLGVFLSRMVAHASELRPTARECHEFFAALEEAERVRDGVAG